MLGTVLTITRYPVTYAIRCKDEYKGSYNMNISYNLLYHVYRIFYCIFHKKGR